MTTQNLPANLSNLVTNLTTLNRAAPVSEGDFQYLKLSKAGEWVFGADETEVSNTSVFVIDPHSYMQGYIAWNDGELEEEVMALQNQPAVIKADLPELPQGVQWQFQSGFALKCIEGEDEGEQMIYKTSSKGGKEAVQKMLNAIVKEATEGSGKVCPVVMLSKSSYKHKKYGKIYTPVFEIDEWLEVDAAAISLLNNEPEKAVEPEPAPEPEPEPETPKRRRRSRA